jgi:hypothetical protein
MTPTAILYPGIAMFFLTFGVMLWLGHARYRAIHARRVSIKYFRTFDEGEQPERLHLLSRHMQNHFEIPPLFYAGILFTYASGSVTLLSVILAWSFFATRCVHSFIHLGANDVSIRFFTFGVSLLFLAGLWGSLLVSLLTRGA